LPQEISAAGAAGISSSDLFLLPTLLAWQLALLVFFFARDFFQLLLAEDDFTLADKLVVEPEAVLVGGGFEANAGRTAQQAHSCGSLKNVGRKGAAIDVEFDA
jgi:hypothetical protein